jgi:N-succinyldiaminopimelate aminotransferase
VPKYPSLSAAAQSMPESLFAALMRRLERFEGEQVIQFQIGDTHLDPPLAARLGNLGFTGGPDPDLYRYSPAPGKAQFIEGIADKLRRDNLMGWVGPENIQVTCGATHALSCAVRAVLNHGDQILLLAPHWPLMRGISVSAGVGPVEVPFSHVLLRDGDTHVGNVLESFITPLTAAIYMSTPNNPDGKVYTETELEMIADVARRHNLWVISDEVYEKFTFDGRPHLSIANLPGMQKRTITVFSFSKSYGMPGLRVGYVVAPATTTIAIRKMANHTIYSVPRAMQRAAHAAMDTGHEFLDEAVRVYQEARDIAFERVVAPCAKPEGCTYLFLDLTEWCRPGEDSCLGVLERLAEAGVLLAPGGAFGHLYSKWARLCYTSVSRAQLIEGIDRVNCVLDSVGTR